MARAEVALPAPEADRRIDLDRAADGPWAKLSVRIGLLVLFAVGVTALLAFWQVRASVNASNQHRYAAGIDRGITEVTDEVERAGTLTLIGAVVLGESTDFAHYLAERDMANLLRVAISLGETVSGALSEQSGFNIYDERGRFLFRAHDPFNRAEGGTPPQVMSALSSVPVATVREDPVVGLVTSGFAPIKRADGTTVGVLETLTKLDAAFAAQLADVIGARVAIVGPSGVQSTSVRGWQPAAEELAAAPAAPDAEAHFVTVLGVEYLSRVVPLHNDVGEQVGSIFVGIDRLEIEAGSREALRSVSVGVAIALAVSAVATIAFTLVMNRPLGVLLGAARRLQENDLERPVPRSGPQEFRVLAGALDEMRTAIRAGREDLMRVNAGLSQRVETSTANLTTATQELSVMHTIVAELTRDGMAALPAVVDQLTRLDWVEGAIVANAADGALRVQATSNVSAMRASRVMYFVETSLLRDARSEGTFITDVSTHADGQSLSAVGIASVGVMPLVRGTDTRGVLAVVSARPVEVGPGRQTFLRSVGNEIAAAAERAELAAAADENRRLSQAVLAEMSDGVVVFDAAGRCRVCNPAAARLLNVIASEVITRTAEVWLPVGRDLMLLLRSRALDGEQAGPFPIEIGARQLMVQAGPFVDVADPGQRGMILLFRDLTDVLAADRARQDFVSMVGHELRTPLTMIRTTIDLLTEQEAGELTPTQARLGQLLRNNSDRLLGLVNDLLDMSALESGRVHVDLNEIDLVEVGHEILETFGDDARERGLTLSLDPRSPQVPAWADRGRIRQVFANLVGNALKYTPPGGSVTVRLSTVGELARVDVEDSGIGVPLEEQQRLFEKFYRTREGARQSAGTGLGLAIAKSIIDLHDGDIWCASDGATGSTFSFTLPAHEPARSAPAEAQRDR